MLCAVSGSPLKRLALCSRFQLMYMRGSGLLSSQVQLKKTTSPPGPKFCVYTYIYICFPGGPRGAHKGPARRGPRGPQGPRGPTRAQPQGGPRKKGAGGTRGAPIWILYITITVRTLLALKKLSFGIVPASTPNKNLATRRRCHKHL